MGIFNRAIPNIQTNNLNQVRVIPEEYYVDDIFDPLFNAKVKEQLRQKYGNPFLGTIGGYMEGIDNALLGQDDKWGILGPGMGVLSGFGRSMDKAGDFIIGGLTEGVKGVTGQGFENPLENIFVKDQDYTGTRLLAAMGNSMAGLAKAPQLTEADFKGLWNIPGMALELGTDPGILGGAISKGAKSINIAEQVAGQSASSKLADFGQLLMDYDDFMAKVSMDLTAPGLRLTGKTLLDKIQQKLGNSSAKPLANVINNPKETPEARMQAQEQMRNDPEITSLMEMADEVGKADSMIEQAELANSVNLNNAQAALGVATVVPNAIQEEIAARRSNRVRELIQGIRKRQSEAIRNAYFESIKERDEWAKEYAQRSQEALDNFNNQIYRDMRHTQFSDDKALQYAKELGYINTENLNLSVGLNEDMVAANRANYEALSKNIDEIRQMSPEEASSYGFNPEYLEQIDFSKLDDESIDAGLFYDFVPNEATRNAILAYSGISPKDIKGLQLETPVTFSPSDYTGRSDETLIEGLNIAELKLYNAFESAGVPLRDFKTAKDLDSLLDENSPHFSKFATAFPNKNIRKHLVEQLKILVFPSEYVDSDDLKNGAVTWFNTFNDFANEIIAFNKSRTPQSLPAYETIANVAKAKGMEPVELIAALKSKLSFSKWLTSTKHKNFKNISDILKLETLYNFSENDEIIDKLRKGIELNSQRTELYNATALPWDVKIDEVSSKLRETYRLKQIGEFHKYKALKNPKYDLLQLSRISLGRNPDNYAIPSLATQSKQRAARTQEVLKAILQAKETDLLNVDATFKVNLDPADLDALNFIDRLPVSDPNSVSDALKAIDEYDSAWDNLMSEAEMAENSLQGNLWQNLVELSEDYQKNIYAPLKNRQPISYTSSNLGIKETGYSQDVHGNRIHIGSEASATRDDILNERQVYAERVQDARNNGKSASPDDVTEYSPKAFKSKKFKENIKTDYGRRQISYTNSAEDYETNRYLNTIFRRNQEAFKDPVKFVDLRDTVLKRLGEHYQVKLRPKYFFNVPSSTRIKDIDFSKQSEMANFIRDEGREIVQAFNTEVRPIAESLMRDGVIPWSSKYKPRLPENATIEQVERFNRITANQAEIRRLLGYADEAHPYYKQFRQIQKTLPVQMYGGRYMFKTTSTPISTPITDVHRLNYTYSDKISYDHLTVQNFIDFQNAKVSSDWREPIKVPNVTEKVKDLIGDAAIRPDGTDVPKFEGKLTRVKRTTYKSTKDLPDSIVKAIQDAPSEEAAKVVTDFPSYTDIAKSKVLKELDIPEETMETIAKNTNASPDPPNPSSEPPKAPPRASTPKEKFELFQLVSDSVVAKSASTTKDRATLRTSFVKSIIDDADLLMTRHGVTPEDIAEYKRVQIHLSGAKIKHDEFLDTLASSGMFQMAYKPGEDFTDAMKAIAHNVAEVNVAMGSNVLKPFRHKLSNGNIVIGAMWDTSNKKVLNIVEKNYKNLDLHKLHDITRLEVGSLSDSLVKYISSDKYRRIDELFDRVRQQEGEYARLIGFKFDDARHVKNVKVTSPDVANYLANIVYKDIPVDDLDDISDKMMNLDAFKHLRGSWGTRKYDKRFIGFIEDFEADGLRIFEDSADRIVKGSLAEGSFNNSKFQLYVDLFENDNFKINTYFSSIDELKKVLYAKLEDGSQSGNLQNLVLAAPRKDKTGRIIGFTQFDKTTDAGLQSALNNADTVLLPSHVFASLDKVLRKDAKMSNKIFAFIQKHLTLPFKFGVLMNPGFLIGNANDAYLKQATTMAQKYGTSVPEELSNVAVAVRDVLVLNNDFDDAYRRFLTHIQAEGIGIAPSNQISSLAATDPRIRKMLKDYVNDKLRKGNGKAIIPCGLTAKERNTVKLWLMLNSVHTTAALSDGFQDLDIIAKAKNSSKYQMAKNPIDRILTGQGEYVADDISTWGLFVNNPLSRAVMNGSESVENTFRAASILNDFRHKGMDSKWFADYFKNLDELKEAAKSSESSARFRAELKKKFNVNMTEAVNTMHNANFDYERMTDFTDTVGTFVPFPTFFLKNLGYWLEIMVNNPQYIDHAITVQESTWGSRDTSEDKFAAEAKGRGAVPVSFGGQKLSNFFKGIFKPTPLQSMFGAFSLVNNPVEDVYYRLHPLISGGITAASKLPPVKPIAAKMLPEDNVKYRPYSTDMYERNITRDNPKFNPIEYAIHRANPIERPVQTALRLPAKLRSGQAQLSDFSPSIFQPDFGEKYSK